MAFRFRALSRFGVRLVCVWLFAATAFGQAAPNGSPDILRTPKVQVYVGYSYLRSIPDQHFYNSDWPYDEKLGGTASGTLFLKPWLGIQGEVSDHYDKNVGHVGTSGVGVQFQKNLWKFVPFVHVLAGPNYFGNAGIPKQFGWTGTGGVGVDFVPSYAHQWFGIRLIQADYQYNYNNFGPQAGRPYLHNGIAHWQTVSGSAGVVFRLGGGDHVEMAAQMSCSADRAEINPGEPVTVVSQYLGFDVKKPITYNWQSTAGRIAGNGAGESITIDTTGLAPGGYKVVGTITQGHGHGTLTASCNTGFNIRSPEPPTVSCIAVPSSIPPEGTSTVTASGTSPQNRTLSYTFSTGTLGRIPSTGNVTTVTAHGPGDLVINCNVVDDQGRTATATAIINVIASQAAAAMAPLPLQRDMCTVGFERDRRRPARVDNEAKACLDDIALAMQREQDATLVVLGNHANNESASLAAERAVNVKQYLTAEKGIDPARVQVRATDGGARSVTSIFLPIGSSFNEEGRVVAESQVVHHGEAYGHGTGATRRTTTRRRRRPTVASAQ